MVIQAKLNSICYLFTEDSSIKNASMLTEGMGVAQILGVQNRRRNVSDRE